MQAIISRADLTRFDAFDPKNSLTTDEHGSEESYAAERFRLCGELPELVFIRVHR